MAVKTIRGMRQPAREGNSSTSIWPVSGQTAIGLLFLVALLAFEIFNFDTTRFALTDFLGDTGFAGLRWATILAIAFCAIDFAGLLRFFLPQDEEGNMPPEVWYLMGAWLLGATMNALMTWWAVNLSLLNHDFGNEVLSRQQLLEIVPIFVATLVWVTRILFIGAFSVAGGYLFSFNSAQRETQASAALQQRDIRRQATPLTLRRNAASARRQRGVIGGEWEPLTDALPTFLEDHPEEDALDEEEEMIEQSRRWQARASRRSMANAVQEG